MLIRLPFRALGTLNDNLEATRRSAFHHLFGIYTDNPDKIRESGFLAVPLDDCCTLISKGVTPQYCSEQESDEIILNQRCIHNSRIDFSFAQRHIPKSHNEKWLQYGDILINSTGTGTLGRSAQFWGTQHNIVVDSHITIVRVRDKVFRPFFGALLQTLQSVFENMETGSTAQTDLPRERLKAMLIPLPTIEQAEHYGEIAIPLTAAILGNQKEIDQLRGLEEVLQSRLSMQ